MIFSKQKKFTPHISVIIVSFNMGREIPRTVQSFLPPYQTGIDAADIEILVMENGSNAPVRADIVENWPDNVRYISLDNPPPSPAFALNEGVRQARGDWVCLVIDGARMVTPGVLRSAKEISQITDQAVICTVGYHLGDKVQQQNVAHGYNQESEDALLDSINWPDNPYLLFDISSLGGSAQGAWFAPIAESNVITMHKDVYESLGGYDERFDIPGGGLVNLDFYRRAIEHADTQHYLLFGEGSFHQFHGGVTTSRPVKEPSLIDETKSTWEIYDAQYEKLRGEPFKVIPQNPVLYGSLRPEVSRQVAKASQRLNNQLQKKTDIS